MPEIAAAHRAAQRAGGLSGRRLDLVFAEVVAVVALAGMFAYPYASADETSQAARSDERTASRTAVVSVPALATVRESTVSAPALVEPLPTQSTPAPKAPPVAKAVDAGQRPSLRAAPALVVPATSPVVAAETASGDVKGAESALPPPQPPPAPVDQWQPLRDALGACARSSGVWERATCEQRARLAHCDGYWGNVALCPSGRTEFGQ